MPEGVVRAATSKGLAFLLEKPHRLINPAGTTEGTFMIEIQQPATEPLNIVCSRTAMQRCIEEILYDTIFQVIVKGNIGALETQWDIEKEIKTAELLVALPDVSTLPTTPPPRVTDKNLDANLGDAAKVTEPEPTTGKGVPLEMDPADLDTFTQNIILKVLRTMLREHGIDDEKFYREFQTRVNEIISI